MSARLRYRIQHETAYHYGSDVLHAHHLLHLVPRPAPFQQCLENVITIKPATFRRRDEIDAFGNVLTRIESARPHRELEVLTQMEVDVYPRPAVSAADSLPWEQVCAALAYHGVWPTREQLDASRFRHESPYVRVKQEFTDYAADCFPAGRPILAAADALLQKLHRELKYAPGETTVGTPVREVLKIRRGVCQDFAHLMIACLRSRGLAARYVSGYLRSVPAPGAAPGESPGIGSGASHAWVAVYAPPFGWIEFDPTNNVWVGTDHVAVAWARDFGDVSPLHGVLLGGGTHELSVRVTVEPITPS
jgi:transglutaminase-like putative cysteine protease